MSDVAQQLERAGMSAAAAEKKEALFRRAVDKLTHLAGKAPDAVSCRFVPGRIEVLGKHTDYAGGRSLLCAVERGFCVVAAPRADEVVRVCDVGLGKSAEFELPTDLDTTVVGWTVYPRTVARRIAKNFSVPLRGADIVFDSDLPKAAGLSSSSALVVAVFLALSDINHLEERPEYRANIHDAAELAGYLGCVENGQSFGTLVGDRGVGTFGGSEDHTAMLCCRAGHLSQYSFCPVREENVVALQHEWTFVIGCSGVAASKTGAARERYNRASLGASAILQTWREKAGRADATLAAAVRSSPDAPAKIRGMLLKELVGRFDQFLEESEIIIPRAADAIRRGDSAALGELVDRSQFLAEKLLGNQVPETIALARSARELGAMAASAFGAGFGGSVWALVGAQDAQQFGQKWSEVYRRQFLAGAAASQFFVSGAGPGVVRL